MPMQTELESSGAADHHARLVGWTIVAYGFLAVGFSSTARALLSLAMPLWESELGWSRSLVSTAGALALLVMAVTAPIAGNFIDRFGPRKLLTAGFAILACGLALTTISTQPWHLLVSFGLISGIGFGVVAVNAFFAAVAPYFHHRRGFALAVVDSGSTVGPLIFVPLAALLLSSFGWRFEFIAMAIACLAMAPLAWRLLPTTSGKQVSEETRKDGQLTGRLLGLARSPVFNLLFWSFFLCGFTSSGVIETHFLPYAAICGFGGVEAAGAYGLLSGINLVGILVAGWLSDRMSRPLLLAIIYGVRSLSFVLLMQVGNDLSQLYLFSAIFGLFDYATAPVVASLVASHLGIRVMGLSMGLLGAGHALGAALGALAGGLVFDVYGSYSGLWAMSTAFAVLAGLIAVFIPVHPDNDPTKSWPAGKLR
jgi:MFS family permease